MLNSESEVWLSLVERFVRDEEAAGSNPVTSTIKLLYQTIQEFLHIQGIVFSNDKSTRACRIKYAACPGQYSEEFYCVAYKRPVREGSGGRADMHRIGYMESFFQ